MTSAPTTSMRADPVATPGTSASRPGFVTALRWESRKLRAQLRTKALLGGTILANMAVKLGVTLAYARSKGTTAAVALGASMAALAVSLIAGWLML